MIIIGNKDTYCFEGMHIPRIYIQDHKKVKHALELLQNKGALTNQEMTEETERVRSEDIREIYYLLWRLGFGIDVSKKGRSLVYLANDKLQSFLELNEKNFKKLLLNRLKSYNPFIAVLDKLQKYKNQDKIFTEKDITKDFHRGKSDGGRIDNTHPLLRWSKDTDWNLVKDKKITMEGINYVNEAKKLGVVYVHHTIDLNSSRELNIITNILSRSSLENKKKISFEDILGLIENIDEFEMNKDDLLLHLKTLIEIGLPIKIEKENIIMNNILYHEITPKYYVKFKIHFIDGIDELETEEDEAPKNSEIDKIVKSIENVSTIVIHDEEIDPNFYPDNSVVLNYKEFLWIENYLPNLNIQNIVLPPGWKPLKVSKINGILLSFVRFGGNLIIFHAPMGRIGSNRNLFNWLPYDLSRLSFVHSNRNKDTKGYFTFPFGEVFIFTSKGDSNELASTNDRYNILNINYKKGSLLFIGYYPKKKILTSQINNLKNTLKINKNSKAWEYRYVPSLNRLSNVNTEYDLYPILRKILSKNFGFEFDPQITGKPGQTDLFIQSPFFCCCEVTPPSSNATGFSKVSEVNGHKQNMVFKDLKNGRKRFGKNIVGACVIGPSFTIEAGEDKSGAVDMAEAMKISLISYKDLYELICLNEENSISIRNLKEIFFLGGKNAEAAIQIGKLLKIK